MRWRVSRTTDQLATEQPVTTTTTATAKATAALPTAPPCVDDPRWHWNNAVMACVFYVAPMPAARCNLVSPSHTGSVPAYEGCPKTCQGEHLT